VTPHPATGQRQWGRHHDVLLTLTVVGVGVCTALAGCELPTSTSAIGPTPAGDPSAGRSAFVASCVACHANRDGFDLAFFGFPPDDIIRRAIGHVDLAAARDIAAFVASIDLDRKHGNAPPFQPGLEVADGDANFWEVAFGAVEGPPRLSAEELVGVDLRTLVVPLPFPPWSDESGDGDWLPNQAVFFDEGVLFGAPGGTASVVNELIEHYEADPSVEGLLEILSWVERATTDEATSLCRGHPGTHPDARRCFEARRWAGALAVQHVMRSGDLETVPPEVLDLWWGIGEVAISVFAHEGGPPRHAPSEVAAWFYLAYSFAPDRFPDRFGYMGQFLSLGPWPMFATFVNLRRLVDPTPMMDGAPEARYHAAAMATATAPPAWKATTAEFSYLELLARLETGEIPRGQGRPQAASLVRRMLKEVESNAHPLDPSELHSLQLLSAHILAGLEPNP